jgi:hypothetical protein
MTNKILFNSFPYTCRKHAKYVSIHISQDEVTCTSYTDAGESLNMYMTYSNNIVELGLLKVGKCVLEYKSPLVLRDIRKVINKFNNLSIVQDLFYSVEEDI